MSVQDLAVAINGIVSQGEVRVDKDDKVKYFFPENASYLFESLLFILEAKHTDAIAALRDVLTHPIASDGKLPDGATNIGALIEAGIAVEHPNAEEIRKKYDSFLTDFNQKGEVTKEDVLEVFNTFMSDFKDRLKEYEKSLPKFDNVPKADFGGNEPPTFVMHPMDTNINVVNVARYISELHSWLSVKMAVEHLGGNVELMESRNGGSRVTYTRDPLLIAPDGSVLVTNLGGLEIQIDFLEQKALCTKLAKFGFEEFKISKAEVVGGNVIFDPSNPSVAFVGGALIPAVNSAAALNEELPDTIPIPIQVKSEHRRQFYDLDLIMAVLPRGEIVVCEDLIEPPSVKEIELQEFQGREVIRMNMKTASNGAANIIAVGNTLIMPFCSSGLRDELESCDYDIVTPEDIGLSKGAFIYGEGGPRCLTFELPDYALEALKNNGVSSKLKPQTFVAPMKASLSRAAAEAQVVDTAPDLGNH